MPKNGKVPSIFDWLAACESSLPLARRLGTKPRHKSSFKRKPARNGIGWSMLKQFTLQKCSIFSQPPGSPGSKLIFARKMPRPSRTRFRPWRDVPKRRNDRWRWSCSRCKAEGNVWKMWVGGCWWVYNILQHLESQGPLAATGFMLTQAESAERVQKAETLGNLWFCCFVELQYIYIYII